MRSRFCLSYFHDKRGMLSAERHLDGDAGRAETHLRDDRRAIAARMTARYHASCYFASRLMINAAGVDFIFDGLNVDAMRRLMAHAIIISWRRVKLPALYIRHGYYGFYNVAPRISAPPWIYDG